MNIAGILDRELGLGEPLLTSAQQSGAAAQAIVEDASGGGAWQMGVHQNEIKSGRKHWGSVLTGQRLIERTERRAENMENAGLQRDEASSHFWFVVGQFRDIVNRFD